jgi:alanine racemase
LKAPLVWAEINLGAIAHNVKALRSIVNDKARLMAVVKANAYGHGVKQVAMTALDNGADLLGVARFNEGIELRNLGFDVPILIFGYTPPANAELLVQYQLIQTVSSYEYANALSDKASSLGKKLSAHLKVDTGMGRLGILPDNRRCTDSTPSQTAIEEVASIHRLPGISLDGVYTHFATADSADKTYAQAQLEIFNGFIKDLRAKGIDINLQHAANSGAIIDMPEAHFHMVRAGISLYGFYPSEEVDRSRIDLQPAMTLKSRVAHIKKVPVGFKISYGITYETQQPTTIATIPIGYADGLNRLLSSRGHMLIRGKRAPIVGRVCMDQTMLDVGHIEGVGMGDEVVVFGKQGDAVIPAEEVASQIGSINYEVVCAVTGRVERRYIG